MTVNKEQPELFARQDDGFQTPRTRAITADRRGRAGAGWGIMSGPALADTTCMNGAQRYRQTAAQRYKTSVVGSAMVALSCSVMCAFAIGILPTLILIPATIAAVAVMMKLAILRDRSRRRRGRSADVIAVARSSVWRRELANFSADASPTKAWNGRVIGDLELTREAIAWKPQARGRKLGALDVVIPTSSIRRVDTARLPGWMRCDALCVQTTDGREFVVSATDPGEIEAGLDLVGVARQGTP